MDRGNGASGEFGGKSFLQNGGFGELPPGLTGWCAQVCARRKVGKHHSLKYLGYWLSPIPILEGDKKHLIDQALRSPEILAAILETNIV